LTDIERLFENLLNDAASGKRTQSECVALSELRHPELTPSLRLAFNLGCVAPEAAEFDVARANVWNSIAQTLDQECASRPTAAARPVRPARLVQRRKSPWLVATLCAAILALILGGNWTLTNASAGALPGSPLYGIKRAEEHLQLQLAWSSQMRGEALAQIALHRLAEAREEAARHNTSQALTLMNESNAATHQLIALVIEIHQQRQDDTAVKKVLAATLQAECDALQQARSDGQSALAQALASNVTDQQNVLHASSIIVPPLATPIPTTPTITADPTDPPVATQAPTTTPVAKPTPTTKGSGSNNGKSNNNSNSNSNSHGKGSNSSSTDNGN